MSIDALFVLCCRGAVGPMKATINSILHLDRALRQIKHLLQLCPRTVSSIPAVYLQHRSLENQCWHAPNFGIVALVPARTKRAFRCPPTISSNGRVNSRKSKVKINEELVVLIFLVPIYYVIFFNLCGFFSFSSSSSSSFCSCVVLNNGERRSRQTQRQERLSLSTFYRNSVEGISEIGASSVWR